MFSSGTCSSFLTVQRTKWRMIFSSIFKYGTENRVCFVFILNVLLSNANLIIPLPFQGKRGVLWYCERSESNP